MRPVNLLPPEDRKQRGLNLSRQKLAIIAGSLIFLGVGYMGYSAKSAQGPIKEQIETATRQTDEATQQVTQFIAANKRSQIAKDNEAGMRKLIATRTNWEKVIRQVSGVVPRQVRISTLTAGFSGPANGTAQKGLHLEGTAASRGHVGVLIRRLQAVPGLGEPELSGSLDADATTGRGTVNFTLDIPIDQRAQDRAKLVSTTNNPGTPAGPGQVTNG